MASWYVKNTREIDEQVTAVTCATCRPERKAACRADRSAGDLFCSRWADRFHQVTATAPEAEKSVRA